VIKQLGVYPYFRAISASEGREVVSHGRARVMIGSNNYLGLTHHPRVQAAAIRASERYGTGCTGSHFLNGNLEIHEELEQKMAAFLKKESCLVFSTGFLANLGTISCLVGRNDVIFSDRENHASIVEGTRATQADVFRFRSGDMDALENQLRSERHKYLGAMIVTDGVFSMSGRIADLPGIRRLADEYHCRIYLDDAHSTGVLGEGARGTEEYYENLGNAAEADIVMGTFSKSFATLGCFVAGESKVIDFIRHKARSFIFSAAMSPPAVATVLECLELIQEDRSFLDRLWTNTRRMQRELFAMGFDTVGSQTPIVPLLIGSSMSAFSFSPRLYEHGVFSTPVVSPAVPEGRALIRTSYMATHTDEDLDYCLRTLGSLGEEFGLIRSQRVGLNGGHRHSEKFQSVISPGAVANGDGEAIEEFV